MLQTNSYHGLLIVVLFAQSCNALATKTVRISNNNHHSIWVITYNLHKPPSIAATIRGSINHTPLDPAIKETFSSVMFHIQECTKIKRHQKIGCTYNPEENDGLCIIDDSTDFFIETITPPADIDTPEYIVRNKHCSLNPTISELQIEEPLPSTFSKLFCCLCKSKN